MHGQKQHVASQPSWSKFPWGIEGNPNVVQGPFAPTWTSLTRPFSAKLWEKTRFAIHQSYQSPSQSPTKSDQTLGELMSTNKHLSGWTGRFLKVLSASHDGRNCVLWIMSLFLLVAVVCAQETSAQESPGVIAYDPLLQISEQLTVPVVAGAPPPASVDSELEKKKEQAYIHRMEMDRTENQGSVYVELTPEDRARIREVAGSGVAEVIRYSQEPLPWEVLGQDDDNTGEILDDEEYAALGWSFSPWGGEFRYEAIQDEDNDDDAYDQKEIDNEDDEDDVKDEKSDGGHFKSAQRTKSRLAKPSRYSHHQRAKHRHRKQQGFLASQADMDDGSGVIDEEYLMRVEVSNNGPSEEAGKTLKMEEAGEFSAGTTDADPLNTDPNVNNNINEVIAPQVWDAVGVSQKGPTGEQQYVEIKVDKSGDVNRMEAEDDSDSGTVRPRLDEIDLLGHEAEVDWLDEQDHLQGTYKKKHRHGHGHLESDGDVKYNDEEEEDEDGMMSANSLSFEEKYRVQSWEQIHGGLNPKHYHPDFQSQEAEYRPPSRPEERDRDKDGIIFPDRYSTDPYSKIVCPSVAGDSLSPLSYLAYNRQGDRIMDFSMVGWNEGNTELPNAQEDIEVLEHLSPREEADSDADQGDDTERIQNAIDRVSQTTKDRIQGTDVVPRGALVLERGVYRISKPLKIRASGLLFRGDPIGGSRIVCQWEPTGPRYAIEVEGKNDEMLLDTRIPILSEYTPVGSFYLALDPTFFQDAGLAVGDQVVVTRIGNERWIEDIGMDDFDSDKEGVKPWKKMRGRMYRTIRSINTQTGVVQMDAPLPISIRRHYGGGFVTKYVDNKIRALGIQYLDMVFPKNIGRKIEDMLDEKGRGSKDYRFSYEIFANYALRVDQACHMYVSHVTSAFFHNFISLGTDVHHVTMDSVVHSYPEEMLSGQSAFQLSGQLVLIKNSLSQGSFHFLVDINHVMGPNVFHRFQGTNVGKPYQPITLDFAPGEVGPHMKFCTGNLIDQVVTDGSIQIVNRGDMGTGQGFSGANSVVWNSRAREGILTHRATGFQNFVIGSEDLDANDRQPETSRGWKEHSGSEVLPGSLYLRQLADRMDRLAKGWVA